MKRVTEKKCDAELKTGWEGSNLEWEIDGKLAEQERDSPQNSPGLRVVEKYPSTVAASGPFCNSGKSVSSVWVRQLPRGGTESNIAVIVR